eukprot:TRINITY_DN4488_c0_g1_i7.p1 TRINITY_DN4488_c0_g1~~TRINITY_DN4488_c0_g1_i7.p1  ORF type:complete len:399 (+),score=44.14 TRINITY_DN4488_c0_g1_i7:3-1199(+)
MGYFARTMLGLNKNFSFTLEGNDLNSSLVASIPRSKSTVSLAARDSRRIVLVGASAVGKTAFAVKVESGAFREEYHPTLEEVHETSVAIKKHRNLGLLLVDVPGYDVFPWVSPLRITTGVSGYILAFSVTDRQSFAMLPHIRKTLLELNGRHLPCLLLATKTDLNEERKVSREEAQLLANVWGIPFYEASVKRQTQEALKLVLVALAKRILAAENPRESAMKTCVSKLSEGTIWWHLAIMKGASVLPFLAGFVLAGMAVFDIVSHNSSNQDSLGALACVLLAIGLLSIIQPVLSWLSLVKNHHEYAKIAAVIAGAIVLAVLDFALTGAPYHRETKIKCLQAPRDGEPASPWLYVFRATLGLLGLIEVYVLASAFCAAEVFARRRRKELHRTHSHLLIE